MKQAHEAANLFPMMRPREFKAFKRDILLNGVQTPIVTYKGMDLDGRNTRRAVEELRKEGHKIEFEELKWQGGSDFEILAYVLSINLFRRHLSSGQRAAIAVKAELLANKYRGGSGSADVKMTDEVATRLSSQAGTNRTWVYKCLVIARKSMDLLELIVQGKLSIPQAELASKDKELWSKVKEGKIGFKQAKALRRAKERGGLPVSLTALLKTVQSMREDLESLNDPKLLKKVEELQEAIDKKREAESQA